MFLAPTMMLKKSTAISKIPSKFQCKFSLSEGVCKERLFTNNSTFFRIGSVLLTATHLSKPKTSPQLAVILAGIICIKLSKLFKLAAIPSSFSTSIQRLSSFNISKYRKSPSSSEDWQRSSVSF